MNAQLIAQLVLALGPAGLTLARDLASVWTTKDLPAANVDEICSRAAKPYDAYIAEGRARLVGNGGS